MFSHVDSCVLFGLVGFGRLKRSRVNSELKPAEGSRLIHSLCSLSANAVTASPWVQWARWKVLSTKGACGSLEGPLSKYPPPSPASGPRPEHTTGPKPPAAGPSLTSWTKKANCVALYMLLPPQQNRFRSGHARLLFKSINVRC